MALFAAGFWISAALLIYTWLGYPVLLWVLSLGRPPAASRSGPPGAPSFSIIVAVHNEASAVAAKLQSCLALDYPAERFEIVVASDGSTDDTVAVARGCARGHGHIRVLDQPRRVGKTAVQNAAVAVARCEIVLFSDVDTRLDPGFLRTLAKAFADPRVGCASGALVWTNPTTSNIAAGGTLYWGYEHLLWEWESRLGLLAWGSGACLAVRRSLFLPMQARYGEDCIVPLDTAAQGRRVVFQRDAKAYEPRISDVQVEIRSRVRMTLRSFTGTLSRRRLLNPFRFPGVAWSIVSHKLLRWMTPYLLLTLLLCTGVLAAHGAPVYRAVLAAQVLFYLAAVGGYVCDRCRVRVPGLSTLYAFCVMNLGVSIGVAYAMLGREIVSYRSEG